jgi:hypothetical protein
MMLVMAQELYFFLAFEVAFDQHVRQQMNVMLLVMRTWIWMALQAAMIMLETVQAVSLTIFIWE